MAKRSRTSRTSPGSAAAASAESRTVLLPCMPPPLPAPRAPTQLAFALALGQPDDQLVMPGCEDDTTDPSRVYCPPTDAPAAHAAGKVR
jgi:hypothetical protein